MLKNVTILKKFPVVLSILLAVLSVSSVILGVLLPIPHPEPGSSMYVGYGDTPARIEVNCTLPEIPPTVYIMQVKDDTITKGEASDIASRLFDGIGTFEDEVYGWRSVVGYREVVIFKYGGFMTYDHEQFMHHGYPPEEYPSQDECKRITDQYLAKIMEDETVPRDITVSFQDIVSDIHKTIHRNGTIIEETWRNVHVNYVQKVNGFELYGPGAKIRVYLDKDGNVIGFIGRFWGLEPVREIVVCSPEEAIGKLEARGEVAYINLVKLVYYVEFGGRQVLYPYYYIQGVISDEFGEREFGETVSATH